MTHKHARTHGRNYWERVTRTCDSAWHKNQARHSGLNEAMKPKILVSSSAADVTLAAAAAASLFSVLVLVEVVRASARNALASGCVVPGSSVRDSVSSAVISSTLVANIP